MKITTVLVTGAAGRISYSLIPILLSGSIFGSDVFIRLHLFDIKEAELKLEGVKMEIIDSQFDLLYEVVASTTPELVFCNVDVAILLGGYPRLPGMERRDLILKNAENIIIQAKLLNLYGTPKTKVLVVANPANTNCLVAIKAAPAIPSKNFSCLTRLDEQRLRGICSERVHKKLNIKPTTVKNVFIFGNHSTTQVAHISNGSALLPDGSEIPLPELLEGQGDPLKSDYKYILNTVQNRGAEIIKKMQVSSALSAAEAIGKHVRDWTGSLPDLTSRFSMGVLSDGNPYGVPSDLVFSFPMQRSKDTADVDGDVSIVEGLTISAEVQRLIDATVQELLDEKSQLVDVLQSLL